MLPVPNRPTATVAVPQAELEKIAAVIRPIVAEFPMLSIGIENGVERSLAVYRIVASVGERSSNKQGPAIMDNTMLDSRLLHMRIPNELRGDLARFNARVIEDFKERYGAEAVEAALAQPDN